MSKLGVMANIENIKKIMTKMFKPVEFYNLLEKSKSI